MVSGFKGRFRLRGSGLRRAAKLHGVSFDFLGALYGLHTVCIRGLPKLCTDLDSVGAHKI